MPFKIWVQPVAYTISYSLSGDTGTPDKDLLILVNGGEVVYCTGNCSGTINISAGSTVYMSTSCSIAPPDVVSLSVNIIDNGTTVYSNTQTEISSANDSYGTYTPTGNGSISVIAEQSA